MRSKFRKYTEIIHIQRIIYFDAGCNLCNRMVSFVKRFDSSGVLEFEPIQFSKYNSENLSSIIYVENGREFKKSDAVLQILKVLDTRISWMYYLFKVIPRFLRNILYNVIAKSRYAIFGRCNVCLVSPEKK